MGDFKFKVGVDLEGQAISAFGYPLEQNPEFLVCADIVEFKEPLEPPATYWLPGCTLQGGASGGPWMSNFKGGKGVVTSVNSWAFSNSDGMGGPIIDASEARCLVNAARRVDFEMVKNQTNGMQGIIVNCHDRDCITNGGGSMERMLRGVEDQGQHKVVCGNEGSLLSNLW